MNLRGNISGPAIGAPASGAGSLVSTGPGSQPAATPSRARSVSQDSDSEDVDVVWLSNIIQDILNSIPENEDANSVQVEGMLRAWCPDVFSESD